MISARCYRFSSCERTLHEEDLPHAFTISWRFRVYSGRNSSACRCTGYGCRRICADPPTRASTTVQSAAAKAGLYSRLHPADFNWARLHRFSNLLFWREYRYLHSRNARNHQRRKLLLDARHAISLPICIYWLRTCFGRPFYIEKPHLGVRLLLWEFPCPIF